MKEQYIKQVEKELNLSRKALLLLQSMEKLNNR